ncbi:heavy metal sensor histidine kinase [Propionivibrio limicola]|uniref:heavy metal sensor histidine kinase n=1 Tax=Propionivibrio limicola TaxID=167645 RepID=UPI001FE9098E|nr:heavy metal sensor histidine kinase [Propionivibrio limicola]
MRLSDRRASRASIARRLTALFAAASTAVLLALGYLIGTAVEQHFEEQDLAVLNGKLQLARQALAKVTSQADLDAIPQHLDDALIGHSGLAVVVKAPNGETLFATSGAEFPEALLVRQVHGNGRHPYVWRTARSTPLRGISAPVPTGIPDALPAIVGVATDISHHEQFMDGFRRTLWSFVVLAALLTGVLGWLAVRRGLAPLQAMRQKASGITAQRLDARLDAEAVPAELADLAQTLNAMLARLEASFRRLSDFSSDLAHEFRTPISNLLTQTQVTLSRSRSPEEYREVLASNVEEYERLSRMVADMLFLAKADEGQLIPSREKLDLAPLIDNLVEFYRIAAEEKGVTVSCSGKGEIEGDSLMIRRAISNLLSNAIRHTPSGGQVSVIIKNATASGVSIDVINSGETIPAEHLPRLFDRFYRADSARGGDGMRSGLGLAIAKSIMEAHGGKIVITSERAAGKCSGGGETRFTLNFP